VPEVGIEKNQKWSPKLKDQWIGKVSDEVAPLPKQYNKCTKDPFASSIESSMNNMPLTDCWNAE
jgi:hypothetical protein